MVVYEYDTYQTVRVAPKWVIPFWPLAVATFVVTIIGGVMIGNREMPLTEANVTCQIEKIDFRNPVDVVVDCKGIKDRFSGEKPIKAWFENRRSPICNIHRTDLKCTFE